MKIAIVDDDTALVRSLELLLSSRGHEVWTFHDSARAAKFLQHGHTMDALVIDYVMPGLKGDAVLEKLKWQLRCGCKVVLISGDTEAVARLNLEALGVSVFLPKPLDLEALLEALE